MVRAITPLMVHKTLNPSRPPLAQTNLTMNCSSPEGYVCAEGRACNDVY